MLVFKLIVAIKVHAMTAHSQTKQTITHTMDTVHHPLSLLQLQAQCVCVHI